MCFSVQTQGLCSLVGWTLAVSSLRRSFVYLTAAVGDVHCLVHLPTFRCQVRSLVYLTAAVGHVLCLVLLTTFACQVRSLSTSTAILCSAPHPVEAVTLRSMASVAVQHVLQAPPPSCDWQLSPLPQLVVYESLASTLKSQLYYILTELS